MHQGLLLVLPPIAQARALLTLEPTVAGAALGQLAVDKRKAAVLSVTGQDRAQLMAALAPAAVVELLETLSTDQAVDMVLGMAADRRAVVLADPGVSAAKLGAFLQALSADERCTILATLPPQRLARALGSLPPKERVAALSALPLGAAAGALSVTRPQDSAAALSSLQPAAAQSVLAAMPSRERFLAIEKMKPQIAASFLAAMPLPERVVCAFYPPQITFAAGSLTSICITAASSLRVVPSHFSRSVPPASNLPQDVLSGVTPLAAATIQPFLAPTDLRKETLSALPHATLVAMLGVRRGQIATLLLRTLWMLTAVHMFVPVSVCAVGYGVRLSVLLCPCSCGIPVTTQTMKSHSDQATVLACLDIAVAAATLEKLASVEQRGAVFGALPLPVAKELMAVMTPELRAEILSHSTVPRILEALRGLPAADQVATAGKLPAEKLGAALCIAEPQERARFLAELPPAAVAGALRSMSPRDRAATLAAMQHGQAAAVLEHLSSREQGDTLSAIAAPLAAAVMESMPAPARAAALQDVSPQRVAAIIAELKPDTRQETISLLAPPAAAALLSGALPADRMPLLETFSPEQAAAGLGAMTRHERKEALKVCGRGSFFWHAPADPSCGSSS